MLLIGNQGVGKNKLTDRFCQLLGAEREYMQLHRDTSVQSLTTSPMLEAGRVSFKDSPLLLACRSGRIAVLDEVRNRKKTRHATFLLSHFPLDTSY
jgi:MoxR-like ATPase